MGAKKNNIMISGLVQVSPRSKRGQSCRMMALITSDCCVMRSGALNVPNHPGHGPSNLEYGPNHLESSVMRP